MFGFIKKRLGYKIMVAMLAIILLVLIAEIYMRIYFGTKDRLEIASTISRELADSVYAGIKYPMELGDSEAIRIDLKDIRRNAKDVEVFICNFDQEITYSTHEEKVQTRLSNSIQNHSALHAITETLETGVGPQFDPRKPLEDIVSGRRYLIVIKPILHQKDCYHCHGSFRKVIGGLVVRYDAERTYAQVIAQRKRTFVIAVSLLPVAIALIYLMATRLVRSSAIAFSIASIVGLSIRV